MAMAATASVSIWKSAKFVRCNSDSWNPDSPKANVHPMLTKHLPQMLASSTSNTATPCILVLRCGNSEDVPSLCNHGFDVVGLEARAVELRNFRAQQRCNGLHGSFFPVVMSRGEEGWKNGSQFDVAEKFQGARPGWVFKKGDSGLGYYSEIPQIWRGQVAVLDGPSFAMRQLNVIQANEHEIDPELVAAATFHKPGTFCCAYDRGILAAAAPEERVACAAVLAQLLQEDGMALVLLPQVDFAADDGGSGSGPAATCLFSLNELQRLFPANIWALELLEPPETAGMPTANRALLLKKKPTAASDWRGRCLAGTAMIAAAVVA
eukprot:CAMPEP_0172816316 /NCGR_PEP_ID=MMETSP1075-20121228/12377_1 /TAXON_ID=2916 /ORGANISM="Ceratium fusus, Strain PA161109" /LENGTH=321 /DNA_ID=CAMNT_0013656287 /DNA_START=73 /DNA_END=1035 /DNA_ORIENTATION=-